MANVTRREMYVKSDVGNNNNKFWEVTIYDSGDVLCRWGRVGDSGQTQNKSFGSVDEANKFADSKIKEKTRDGRNGEIAYRKIDVVGSVTPTVTAAKAVNTSDLQRIASSQIKTNNPIVDDLVKYLTKVNAHNICQASGGKITFSDTTGLFATPLGIVTQANIDEANRILLEIGDLVAGRYFSDKKMVPLTNDYLMLVPQVVPRTGVVVNEFWSDTTKLQFQKGILDGLQASISSVTKTPLKTTTVDTPEQKVFDLQLHLLDDKVLIKNISNQFETSKKDMHVASKYKVKQVFSVHIAGERERFENEGKKIGNIQRLYHGTNAANLLVIMTQGLKVPPRSSPHVCGRAFSDGVYFANSSSKSLNYSLGTVWRNGQVQDRVFMFMADVALGKHYTPRGTHDGPFPRPGYDSIWAKANQSGVMNDEIIVYNTNQCSLTYLLELTQ